MNGTIYVNTNNVTFPCQIEEYLRLHCPISVGAEARLWMRLEQKVDGKIKAAERYLDIPKHNFNLSKGALVHRSMLNAFCDTWRDNPSATFTIGLIATSVEDKDGYNPRWSYEVKDTKQ